MNLPKAEQAIINGIYAAVAWLILDLGFLFQKHGGRMLAVLLSQPELWIGTLLGIACIVGLFYKSRLAAVTLLLLFLVPLVVRMAQGVFPTAMLALFSLVLLYFFLSAVLGTFSYHHLKRLEQDVDGRED